jgi:hypothetical protein
MDYGMIGKIEKAKLYAQEPERVTFNTFAVEFYGDNSTYLIHLGPEGWDCTCPGFRAHAICPHIMTLERLFKPMLKRSPLPYAPGQNVVSDIDKAKRYAEEAGRLHFESFEVTFRGDNDTHITTHHDGEWSCGCTFFQSHDVCCHTMALERILKGMIEPAAVLAHT